MYYVCYLHSLFWNPRLIFVFLCRLCFHFAVFIRLFRKRGVKGRVRGAGCGVQKMLKNYNRFLCL